MLRSNCVSIISNRTWFTAPITNETLEFLYLSGHGHGENNANSFIDLSVTGGKNSVQLGRLLSFSGGELYYNNAYEQSFMLF